MLVQIAIGGGLTVVCIGVSALALWIAEIAFTRHLDWMRSPPHAPKLFTVVMGTSALVLADISVCVWIWTVALRLLGLFPTTEETLYFALTAYTTLGLGDVTAPPEWRVLGSMAAASGFVNIGFLTTLLIEGLSHVRMGYRRSKRRRGGA